MFKTFMGVTEDAKSEVYLRADGSVRIPEALRPYMGGKEELRRA